MTAKRPTQASRKGLTVAERDALAERARYTGSKEHKLVRWWGGLPSARQDQYGNLRPRPRKPKTTICHLVTDAERDCATGWIQQSIRDGRYRFIRGDGDFPKHVWHTVDGQDWFGFCINTAAGEYKGWPLEQGELNDFLD